MRLGHKDWERVSDFLQELYAQRDAGAFRHTVLAGLSELIPCEHAGYNEIDSRNDGLVCVMHPWVPEVFALAPLLEAHFAEHPQLAHYRQSADRQVYQTTDFLSLRQFQQKGIYQDFYRHTDTDHQLTCLLSEQGAAEDIGIGLNRKLKKFSERDRAVLNHLRPHLIRARQNAAAIARAGEQVQSLTQALEAVQTALGLVDGSGRLTWATAQVERWLELFFPQARRSPGRLPDALERWLHAQRSALKQHAALKTPLTPLVIHREQSTLTIRCQFLPDGPTRLILSQQHKPAAAERGRELGLTGREAEVLRWISEGKTNPEIAVILGISPRTVHKHVEHILTKFGVETRLAAVRLALVG